MKLRTCCLIMCLVLQTGCAGTTTGHIYLGIGVYSLFAQAHESRKRQRAARDGDPQPRRGSDDVPRTVVIPESTGFNSPASNLSDSSAMRSDNPGSGVAGPQAKNPILPAFQEGKEDFKRFRYQNCKAKMLIAAAEANSPESKAQAIFYAGACSFYLGWRSEAGRYFSQVISLNPGFVPNPNTFTPALISFYRRCGKK
ncbi:MAG: hypothetical protein A2X34_07820 [Elusimicrobia bacterium GWC2_51_8]|nr:MAG: hypothetical protein A2X33_10020 [Elusimicrobia bacterium GWA2_51_34]OGR61894.1 MAG: hypothetical protein A2X34_07820 [Elusimicrobia bacterium GWC2_51_8]OGR84699.1 MAG: hypothetical protein A2021_03735 [Elusimicrobia bacterium GWF2_52_66]